MSARVIVALGSNLGDRLESLKKAKAFLSSLSDSELKASSVYRSDPVGPASNEFLNAVVAFKTSLKPGKLLTLCKAFEYESGRDPGAPRWSDRPVDLDIIAYGNRKIDTDILHIPHREYPRRLFVLLPLAEIYPGWKDPQTGNSVKRMIADAPQIGITKTNMEW